MTVKDIKEKSGLKIEVAESLYWHSIYLRNLSPDANISWYLVLKNKNYRLGKEK